MISINLIPDVKQELIRAQRVRSAVISLSNVIGIVAVGVVILLSVYVFGVQSVRGNLTDNSIESENATLVKVPDLSDTLTIQNQLTKLSEMHNNKAVSSRMFDMLLVVVPPPPNKIAISKVGLDTEEGTITVDAQADNGYLALEVFRKTLAATNFVYRADGDQQSVPLASDISDSNRSFGEDASGKKVLRFTVSFTYPTELFERGLSGAVIVGPTRTNATDSYVGVPDSLFTQRAADSEGN